MRCEKSSLTVVQMNLSAPTASIATRSHRRRPQALSRVPEIGPRRARPHNGGATLLLCLLLLL